MSPPRHGKSRWASISSLGIFSSGLPERIYMQRFTLLLTVTMFSLAAVMLAQPGHTAGSGGMDDFDPNSEGLSAEERSAAAYNAGLRHRDRALKHEARAAKAGGEQARKHALNKAQSEFEKAVAKQGEAIKLDPQNYRAANELGFALRKRGAYQKAIGAYNFALMINPEFHQATEYRAEAFLALGNFDKTRAAYMQLFRNAPDLADQLMARLETWVAEHQSSATPTEAEFIAWVQERRALAKVTADLSANNTRSW